MNVSLFPWFSNMNEMYFWSTKVWYKAKKKKRRVDFIPYLMITQNQCLSSNIRWLTISISVNKLPSLHSLPPSPSILLLLLLLFCAFLCLLIFFLLPSLLGFFWEGGRSLWCQGGECLWALSVPWQIKGVGVRLPIKAYSFSFIPPEFIFEKKKKLSDLKHKQWDWIISYLKCSVNWELGHNADKSLNWEQFFWRK